MAELDDVKREVALASRILAAMGLADGASAALGHASLRVPSALDTFVIKALGPALAETGVDDLVVVNTDGFKVGGPKHLNLPNEVKMHSCILREHPEVQAVVHVHPAHTVLLSVQGVPLRPMRVEGLQLFRTPMPLFPSPRLIIREEDGAEVAALLGEAKVLLLQGHGAATVGGGLEEAVVNMQALEEQARMNWLALAAMGREYASIPPEKVREFVENLRRTGEQAHLKPEQPGPAYSPGGVWRHYAGLAGG
jgi:L-fuculose-phosphate aldolase